MADLIEFEATVREGTGKGAARATRRAGLVPCVIYGDKTYANTDRQADYEGAGVQWRVNRKATRGKKLTCADRSFNRKSNRTRAKVEHAFGVIKHLWGYRKVRYQGLEKNAAQVFALFALSNLYMARRELAALQGECA